MKLRQHIYTSARLLGAALFSLSLPIALSSCDTTEEGYHVGTPDNVALNASPDRQLLLAADGKPKEIVVSSNVDWEIVAPDRIFSVTADDRHGDGIIIVSAGLNVNPDSTRKAELRIYNSIFNKSIEIELIQAKMVFSMGSQSYDEASEQGRTYNLTFNSSVDWNFKASNGDINWLEFNPGVSGEGDWNETTVKATFLPNYTTEARSITLQLNPIDSEILGLIPDETRPKPFTLTQAAGTLPTDVAIVSNGESTYTSIPVTVSYASNAPIDQVGVILDSGLRFVAPLQEGATYPQSGSVSFSVEGLDQKTLYNFTPFVLSKVGESTGAQIQLSTDGDIDFDGPELVGYNVDPSTTSVVASFEIQSDVQIQTVTIQLRDETDAVIAEQRENVNALTANIVWNQSVTLQHNTDYHFTLSADIINPNTQNVDTYTLPSLPFRTTLRTPQEDDNQPIN